VPSLVLERGQEDLVKKTFTLSARVSSDSPSVVKPVLERLFLNKGTVEKTRDGEFEINARMEGESAKDLNRSLLSELRRAEKKTRLRTEWTVGDTTEKFFDYVPKGIKKNKVD
jgi:hypothetical protein